MLLLSSFLPYFWLLFTPFTFITTESANTDTYIGLHIDTLETKNQQPAAFATYQYR